MPKTVELRRHTANDGDVLTPEGIDAARAIGAGLVGPYDLLISSGAQRATQTLACFLAVMPSAQPAPGVEVDARFRSDVEDRWRDAYERAGAGDIASFRTADPDLVAAEAAIFADALRAAFGRLPDGGRALVVGHSPMLECAIFGLTGRGVDPLGKGEAFAVTARGDTYQVEPA